MKTVFYDLNYSGYPLNILIIQKKKLGHLPCFCFKTSEPTISKRTSSLTKMTFSYHITYNACETKHNLRLLV